MDTFSATAVLPRLVALVLLLSLNTLFSQVTLSTPNDETDYEALADQLIQNGLRTGESYAMLEELTSIGSRMAGSPQMAQAIRWAKRKMETLGLENVRLQPVMVRRWERGPVEEASIVRSKLLGSRSLSICALGGSIATPREGITAEVIEVQSFEELRKLGDEARGKIVFFNRPMDPATVNPFRAYGDAVSQRSQGAIEAAKVGGVAALVRSLTMAIDDVPHTGAMNYVDTIPRIPGAAISTLSANLLSDLLRKEKKVTVRLKLTSEPLPDTESANVIGELVGRELPGEIVLIGAHLDSWDKGTGAHDDAAGCVHVLEAVRLLRELNLRPRRTIRVVLFENEEHGLRGAYAYANDERSGEMHIAGIESDAGGFSPRGFGVAADSASVRSIARWEHLFRSIGADRIVHGFGGADLIPLMRKGVPGIGLHVDPHRYFDYHHSDHDTIDKVHPRELQLGAIAVAILAYILAEEGI